MVTSVKVVISALVSSVNLKQEPESKSNSFTVNTFKPSVEINPLTKQ